MIQSIFYITKGDVPLGGFSFELSARENVGCNCYYIVNKPHFLMFNVFFHRTVEADHMHYTIFRPLYTAVHSSLFDLFYDSYIQNTCKNNC